MDGGDSMALYIKVLALIALLFSAITFGTQNSESVPLRYYFGIATAPLPLYLIIYFAIILGMIAGMAFGIYSRVAMKAKVRRLEGANTSLRGELQKMRGESGEGLEEKPVVDSAESQIAQTE